MLSYYCDHTHDSWIVNFFNEWIKALIQSAKSVLLTNESPDVTTLSTILVLSLYIEVIEDAKVFPKIPLYLWI